MAIRIIKTEEDDILRKQSKKVDKISKRIITLLDDMNDTLEKANGLGLAAPQVGILKKIFVTRLDDEITEFINPVIMIEKGEQLEAEGCLSIPGVFGIVKRPLEVKIEAQNRDGEIFVMEAKELLARVISHENDHLKGILFKDKIERYINEEEFE
ncbi:MAG: peptide deformylase [Clostridiales bacterium]